MSIPRASVQEDYSLELVLSAWFAVRRELCLLQIILRSGRTSPKVVMTSRHVGTLT